MRPALKSGARRARGPASQHAAMRRGNENTILSLLRRQPGTPGSLIAKRTGLAPQTVSVLLRGLESEGLIARGAVLRGKRGQPAVPFHLKGDAAYAIGVEISWQHADFVLLDLAGRIVHGDRIRYRYPDPARLVADTLANIEKLQAEIPRRRAHTLGVALTGPVGLGERAWVLGASEAECAQLEAIDLAAEITAKTGLPVSTTNDGNSALWAEAAFGRVPRDRDCAHVFLSTFIGSALFIDDTVLVGKDSGSVRIGAAMTAHPDGKTRALHFSSSLWALTGFLAERGHAVSAHDMAAWDWTALEADFADWLATAADSFALAFANTAAIVGVETLIVDSVLPRAVLARIINAIQTRINTLPIEVFETPRVLMGLSGASAPAIGAAYQMFHTRYFAV